jgi:uncharacterized membrane protein
VKKHLEKHLVWYVLGLALLLRLPLLGGSLWMDEAAQALESSRPFSEQLMIKGDFQPPLMHLSTFFMIRLGRAEWWLRLSPLLSGMITIWAIYYIAKKNTTPRIALLTSLLVAFNSFHIFFSQELRPYAMTCLWVSLGWVYLLKMTEHTIITPRLLLGFILTSIAGMYSTYLFPFAFLGQLLFLFSRRSRLFFNQAIIAGVVTSLAFAPWVPYLMEQISVSAQLRARTPDWETVVSTPQVKALQLVFGKFVFGVIDLELNAFFIAISLTFLAVSAYLLWHLRKRIGINAALIIGCWFLVPVFSVWLFSFIIPVLQPKRVLFALPAFELLVAVLIVYGWEWKKTRLAALILAVIVISTHLAGTIGYYTNPRYQREDWRWVIAAIDTQYSASNTVVVFGFDEPFSPWNWYPHQPFDIIATGTDTKTEYTQIEEHMVKALQYEHVIVFDYLTDLTDPNTFILTFLEKYKYQPGQIFDVPNLGFVRVYQKGGSFADSTQRHD